MCGRYTLYSSPTDLARHFNASLQYSFAKSFNIAPTSMIAVIVEVEMERLIIPMRWGLMPSWYNGDGKFAVLNNAKIETVDTKPSFRAPFKRQRCLVLADGFYEWDAIAKPKQPYYFCHKKHTPIALAGIWDRCILEDKAIDSCAIITAPANAIVSPVHYRMPAIIMPECFDQWMNADLQDVDQLKSMAMLAGAYSEMTRYPVTSKMNRVAFNNIQCIEKLK